MADQAGQGMRVKIQRVIDTLCGKCSRGHVRVDNRGKLTIYCNEISKFIEERVVECSDFHRKYAPGERSIYDMEKIAYLISPKEDGRIGFLRPGSKKHMEARRDRDWDND